MCASMFLIRVTFTLFQHYSNQTFNVGKKKVIKAKNWIFPKDWWLLLQTGGIAIDCGKNLLYICYVHSLLQIVDWRARNYANTNAKLRTLLTSLTHTLWPNGTFINKIIFLKFIFNFWWFLRNSKFWGKNNFLKKKIEFAAVWRLLLLLSQ